MEVEASDVITLYREALAEAKNEAIFAEAKCNAKDRTIMEQEQLINDLQAKVNSLEAQAALRVQETEMDLGKAAMLTLAVYGLTELGKRFLGSKLAANSRIVALLALIVGQAAVWLVGTTAWAHEQVIGSKPLDELNSGSKVLVGLMLAGVAAFGSEFLTSVRSVGANQPLSHEKVLANLKEFDDTHKDQPAGEQPVAPAPPTSRSNMPSPIYDGAVQIAGAFRGYGVGQINLTTAIRHYTVGVNSIGTCGRGFQMLQARNGVLYQGAEVDAKNWGAGDPWNGCSLHIEAEWHPTINADEPVLNNDVITSLANLAAWLESEWGIRRSESYHGEWGRTGAWRGWIDHCWLLQSGGQHYNFWPIEQWQSVAAGGPQKKGRKMEPGLHQPIVAQPGHPDNQKVFLYDPYGHTRTWIRTQAALDQARYIMGLSGVDGAIRSGVAIDMLMDARDTDTFSLVTPPGGGGGSMPTDYARREDVAASTAAVILEVRKPKTLQ